MGEIFEDAKHPYTRGLLRSLPALSRGKRSSTVSRACRRN
ncbi:MAG: hypothetical protein ACLR2E_10265 [Lachnospiraceae bacterium]